MRKPLLISLICFLWCALASEKSFSQILPDTSAQQGAFNKAVTQFRAALGGQSPIYNGRQYFFYEHYLKGNAYFQDVSDFTAGSVFYDGALYINVSMIYDLYGKKIVVLMPDHFSTISLLNERVKSFDFLNHHFINISADTLIHNEAGLKSGYYDEIYQGKTQVLVRRSKSIQEISGGFEGIEHHFSYSADFYVKKNNIYYSAGNQNTLLEVLKDKRKELQHFIKSSKIKFRKNPEESLVKISSYYDHLAN